MKEFPEIQFEFRKQKIKIYITYLNEVQVLWGLDTELSEEVGS